MKKKIIIISGDPNSINSEIIYKSWRKLSSSEKKKIYFISNISLLEKQFKLLKYNIKIQKVDNIFSSTNSKNLKIININLKFKNPFKVSNTNASTFVLKSLNHAHKIALKNEVMGIINCPINKKLLIRKKIGVTEYLSRKCKIKNNSEAMLIRNKKLSVCPVTTHIHVKNISKKINKQKIVNKIKTIYNFFKENFKKKPKIAILGLNPHNAELIKGSEEKKVIIPAINYLKRKKFDVTGPLVSDTIFINQHKKFDVIVGMFHDQVLAPFKAIFKFDAINLTLGLKYLRVSPDHGVGSDLVLKKKANPNSLIKCIKFINRYGK